MTRLTDNDIHRITDALIDRTLPKPEWTHEAHFAAALGLLARDNINAFRDMPGLIRAYNLACGVANTETSGYHETITLASLRAARWHLNAEAGRSLAEALAAIMASECGNKDWLLAYWSRPALFSAEARRIWTEPDVAPLPFA